MRIAFMFVDDLRPGAARAVARHVDDLHRHVKQPPFYDGLRQCARDAIETAAGRRASDDLHAMRRLKSLAHYLAPTPKPPSTFAHNATSSL